MKRSTIHEEGAQVKMGKLSDDGLSEEQKLVCSFVESGAGNGLITARAGCGKTSILIEVLRRIRPDKKESGQT
jgi:stage III sporulation protein SpoIIIAA